MNHQRIYILVDGARLWCLPASATIGHSILTLCDARANQHDMVSIASDPPTDRRCGVCELAVAGDVPVARGDFEHLGGDTAEHLDLGGEA